MEPMVAAWSVLLKGTVDAVMDAQITPAIHTQEDFDRRQKEINDAIEEIAKQNGITTADIYRAIGMSGHPDEPTEVDEDIWDRRDAWEKENPGVIDNTDEGLMSGRGWGGTYIGTHGIEPDPELRRLNDEWWENTDHPGGDEHLDSLDLPGQVRDAMHNLMSDEYEAYWAKQQEGEDAPPPPSLGDDPFRMERPDMQAELEEMAAEAGRRKGRKAHGKEWGWSDPGYKAGTHTGDGFPIADITEEDYHAGFPMEPAEFHEDFDAVNPHNERLTGVTQPHMDERRRLLEEELARRDGD